MHAKALSCWRRLEAAGLDIEVQELPEPPATAAAAAAALGCATGQVAETQLWVVRGRPLLVLRAGDTEVDPVLLGAGDGANVAPARPDQQAGATGHLGTGLPPLGHERVLPMVVDAALRRFATVWCAAGTASAVFEVSLDALLAAIPHAELRPIARPDTSAVPHATAR